MTDTLIGRKDHLTFRGNAKKGRHGWLRLTPAYSLHVVENILEDSSEHDIVLDPFSGTGTTALASARKGIACYALDINPFLIWLGNLKCSVFSKADQESFRQKSNQIVSGLRAAKVRGLDSVWSPDLKNIEKWWDPPALKALAHLFEKITKGRKSRSKDLLRIAFLRTMISVAHVSFGHQSMSFKQRKCEQEPLFDSAITCEDIFESFLSETKWISETLLHEQPIVKADIFLGDARAVQDALPKKKITLVITSPPYPNRMSYIRELRPYMYWLGYLTNGRQAGELDWQAIGGTWGRATSLLNKWTPQKDSLVPFSGFYDIIKAISQRRDTLGRYVHKYFIDMKYHIRSLKKVLAPGARCHYIVGNSKFYDTLLPVEEIFAALFEGEGFRSTRIEVLRKRTSKKELFEYCVYAEA